jgi:hypothetical protein
MLPGRRSPTVADVAALLEVRGLRWRVVAGACALACFQVAGTIGASHNGTGARGLDALALAVAVAGPLSLVVLDRWPRPVMWFVVAITLFYLLRGYAYGPVFATPAIATVATVARGYRTTAWSGLATVLVGLFGVRNPLHNEAWSWTWVSGLVDMLPGVNAGSLPSAVMPERPPGIAAPPGVSSSVAEGRAAITVLCYLVVCFATSSSASLPRRLLRPRAVGGPPPRRHLRGRSTVPGRRGRRSPRAAVTCPDA